MSLKQTILGAAVALARKKGLQNVTREDVAAAAEAGTGTINYHFGDMDGLREAVVEYALTHEVVEILAQARADRHPRLGRMSAALKERVASHIVGK